MSEEEPSYMLIQDFMDLGFLQEVNRCILHPAGLALAMHKSDGDSTTVRIWDYRDDPEGVVFSPGVILQSKIESVQGEIGAHVEARMELFGTSDSYGHIQRVDTPTQE